jgi:hypothetical protein
MGTPEVRRHRVGEGRPTVWAAALVTVLVAGCGAGVAPSPSPVPPSSSTPSSTTVPSVPPDGVGLAALGVRNGPVAFSLPRSAVLVTAVDQPNSVVLVLSAPTPADVAAYLRRALPAAGFRVGAPADTFTFTGRGWSGSFTTSAGSSAILLRPA